MPQPPHADPESARSLHTSAWLSARVGPWTVLFDTKDIAEIVPRVAIRPLPGAPAGVLGVFVHRAHEAVAIDLRERFGVPAPVRLWDAIVVWRGAPRWGLIVDAAVDVGPPPEGARMVATLPTERVAGLVLAPTGEALLVEPARLIDAAAHARLLAALADRRDDRDRGGSA